jgi:hypothetical protein
MVAEWVLLLHLSPKVHIAVQTANAVLSHTKPLMRLKIYTKEKFGAVCAVGARLQD